MSSGGDKAPAAVRRVAEIAEQLREIEARLEGSRSSEVEMTLLERAAELADEAVSLLERLGRGDAEVNTERGSG